MSEYTKFTEFMAWMGDKADTLSYPERGVCEAWLNEIPMRNDASLVSTDRRSDLLVLVNRFKHRKHENE